MPASGTILSPVAWLRFLAGGALAITFCLPGGVLLQRVQGQSLPTSSSGPRIRQLAPDALEVIPPAQEMGDTFQGPVDLPFVSQHPELDWTPNYTAKSETLLEKGKHVIFRGDAYALEFAFKPVRMISVEVPTSEGFRETNVWYLLYRVRYLGQDLKPVPEQDPYNNLVYTTQPVAAKWVRFMPTFTLKSLGLNQSHLDRILPVAVRSIAAKERVGKKLYDSVEIQSLKIGITTETENNAVWGVATWVGIDPRTDFFSVSVKGLTNAQRLELDGDSIRYLQKTLVLHFTRPGDTINELEDQIRFGIPAITEPERQKYVLDQFGLEERLDYQWLYR